MNNYFRLPFQTDIAGIVGFLAAVWVAMWLGHKVPVVKGLVRGG